MDICRRNLKNLVKLLFGEERNEYCDNGVGRAFKNERNLWRCKLLKIWGDRKSELEYWEWYLERPKKKNWLGVQKLWGKWVFLKKKGGGKQDCPFLNWNIMAMGSRERKRGGAKIPTKNKETWEGGKK